MFSVIFGSIFGLIFLGLVLLIGVAAVAFGLFKVICYAIREMRASWTGKKGGID